MALSSSKKTISILLRGVTFKYDSDFYCLNCLHSFATKTKLELHKAVCETKDFWDVFMPSKDTKILEFNPYQKSDKASFIIYADLACIIENRRLMDVKIILKVHLQQK